MKKGQQVKIKTSIVHGNEKLVPIDWPSNYQVKTFTILSCPNEYNSFYSILVEDRMLGWIINQTHLDYNLIDKKYLGKKFFDVDNSYFIKE